MTIHLITFFTSLSEIKFTAAVFRHTYFGTQDTRAYLHARAPVARQAYHNLPVVSS